MRQGRQGLFSPVHIASHSSFSTLAHMQGVSNLEVRVNALLEQLNESLGLPHGRTPLDCHHAASGILDVEVGPFGHNACSAVTLSTSAETGASPRPPQSVARPADCEAAAGCAAAGHVADLRREAHSRPSRSAHNVARASGSAPDAAECGGGDADHQAALGAMPQEAQRTTAVPQAPLPTCCGSAGCSAEGGAGSHPDVHGGRVPVRRAAGAQCGHGSAADQPSDGGGSGHGSASSPQRDCCCANGNSASAAPVSGAACSPAGQTVAQHAHAQQLFGSKRPRTDCQRLSNATAARPAAVYAVSDASRDGAAPAASQDGGTESARPRVEQCEMWCVYLQQMVHRLVGSESSCCSHAMCNINCCRTACGSFITPVASLHCTCHCSDNRGRLCDAHALHACTRQNASCSSSQTASVDCRCACAGESCAGRSRCHGRRDSRGS